MGGREVALSFLQIFLISPIHLAAIFKGIPVLFAISIALSGRFRAIFVPGKQDEFPLPLPAWYMFSGSP